MAHPPQRRVSWRMLVALALMLAALLAYVASLDDSDPDPLEPMPAAATPAEP